MAGLNLEHIYKVYPNGTKAVNDFNMNIQDGEFIVFVGPSGCGKSTTLRMIAGLEEITAGELRIDGKIMNDVEPKDRDIAMVFQNYALYPHMTIYDNIAFGLKMRKVPKAEIEQRVNSAAEILGITEYLKRKPKEMSGGQRQRVALGRAIVREPKVMLLDEPLSNLDAKLRTQMRSEIVKLHNRLKTTFIYVTHDQVEAMTMGTRIVVMKDGFIMQIDNPKNLYQHPQNKFVAGFIGTPQMNFINGKLTRKGDKVIIAFDGCDSWVTAPYSMFTKVEPKYLKGDITVCIGMRADDIVIDKNVETNADHAVKMKISHTEQLGTETLVYGDLNLNAGSFDQSDTGIIVKSAGFDDFASDEVCTAVIDLNGIHLFDAETEQSILPLIPQYSYAECEVNDNNLNFCGTKAVLPPAIICSDGSGEMLIPPDAVTFDGEIPAKVVLQENINGCNLATLDVNGNTIFAITDGKLLDKEVKIGIDFKKVTLKINGIAIDPMPAINGIDGNLYTEKVKAEAVDGKKKIKKIDEYYFICGEAKYKLPQNVASRMLASSAGKKAEDPAFRYEWTPYELSVSDDGIDAQVLGNLDYGREKFVKCSVGDEIIYVKTDREYSGDIKLTPDMDSVKVIEKSRQLRIV